MLFFNKEIAFFVDWRETRRNRRWNHLHHSSRN